MRDHSVRGIIIEKKRERYTHKQIPIPSSEQNQAREPRHREAFSLSLNLVLFIPARVRTRPLAFPRARPVSCVNHINLPQAAIPEWWVRVRLLPTSFISCIQKKSRNHTPLSCSSSLQWTAPCKHNLCDCVSLLFCFLFLSFFLLLLCSVRSPSFIPSILHPHCYTPPPPLPCILNVCSMGRKFIAPHTPYLNRAANRHGKQLRCTLAGSCRGRAEYSRDGASEEPSC